MNVKEMPAPRVSVLVLFYNLVDCVDYCLDSLFAQTYRDYEILCVDDGSTDGTYEKLREHEMAGRIRLARTDDVGVSRARNVAVELANGAYVTFVDGDDIISPHYLEFLARALEESGAEQAIGKFCSVVSHDGRLVHAPWPDAFAYERLDRGEMAHRFLYGDTIISPCCHLARREVYVRHPFPAGKVYEDTLTFEAQVLSCDSFALVDAALYGYVKRWESITKPSVAKPAQIDNFAEAIAALGEGVRRMTPSQARGLVYRTALEYSRLYRLAWRIRGDEVADYWAARALEYVRSHLAELRGDAEVPRGDKLRFTVLAKLPGQYDRIFSRYESAAFKRESK